MIADDNFDFSFSGLKTAVLRKTMNKKLSDQQISDLAASFQDAAVDLLVEKTIRAARQHNAKTILLAGGVAANQRLRNILTARTIKELPKVTLHAPPISLCTDNAAMIAAAAHTHAQEKDFTPWQKLSADPNLRLGR